MLAVPGKRLELVILSSFTQVQKRTKVPNGLLLSILAYRHSERLPKLHPLGLSNMQSANPNTDELVSHGDHFFEAEGIRFHYFVRGSGPLMIFQSVGWGVSGGFLWNSLGPHMEKNNTVLYLEPRGNGQSSKPSDPATMCAKTMAEDLEHFRKHL